MRKNCCPRGFTLIELLVVVAIIATLASLLLPSLGRAKAKARSAVCLNILKQFGIGCALYAGENADQLPQSVHQRSSWTQTLQPFLSGTNLHRCPVDPTTQRQFSYAINDFLTRRPFGASDLDFSRTTVIPRPADSLHFAESADAFVGSDHFHFADLASGGYTPPFFAKDVAVSRHLTTANYLFADSHVEALRWVVVKPRLVQPGSRFVRPDGQ